MFSHFVAVVALLVLSLTSRAASTPSLRIDRAHHEHEFLGIGGLSGGGATSLLAAAYPKDQQDEIFDILFKPQFGASLQIIKVEIGGDSQSTDGTESSHMHTQDDLDYHRGYEWEILVAAKQRNPDIKVYGLPWAYPGWVSGPDSTGSPFSDPSLTAHYILKWLQGARSVYQIEVDYIGIWNERDSNATYVKLLRQTLDENDFKNTRIVAKDGDRDICDEVLLDPDYEKAVDIIGLHYPNDFDNYTVCHSLKKPIWASEESSSYDDLNGAACWGRIITSHFVLNQMTSSIMWNLVGSYYHGTNWYASSLLTAVQPWSGYYEKDMPVVWATAHVTQFTRVGWRYLDNGSGSGELPNGGYYTSLIDPDDKSQFTLIVVKISRDHASCTRPPLPDFDVASEVVTFNFQDFSHEKSLQSLNVWYSNFETNATAPTLFERQANIAVSGDGTFSLNVPVGSMFTLSTVGDATKGTFPSKGPTSEPSFPLPYKDDFQSYPLSGEAKYFADQIGAFEIHPSSSDENRLVMRQMVPRLPIGWSDHGSNGPMTLIGMLEWQDINIETDFLIPADAMKNTSVCVGTRADQMWQQGIIFCVSSDGAWTLTQGGPKLGGHFLPGNILNHGILATGPVQGKWHSLSLSTESGKATGVVDKEIVFSDFAIRDIDVGFAILGMNQWESVEFGSIAISKLGPRWATSPLDMAVSVGDKISLEECSTNGIDQPSQSFDLRSDWLLEHRSSGLCAEASSAGDGATLSLQKCQPGKVTQEFRNDYTNIRNSLRPITLGAWKQLPKTMPLTGSLKGGAVTVGNNEPATPGTWKKWVYFPNTHQVRNQYTTIASLGYPLCLTASAGKV